MLPPWFNKRRSVHNIALHDITIRDYRSFDSVDGTLVSFASIKPGKFSVTRLRSSFLNSLHGRRQQTDDA